MPVIASKSTAPSVEPNLSPNLDLRGLPQPNPSSGLDAYNLERELCLAGSSEKRKNYEKYISSRRRGAKLDYLPIKLDIENASRCNFRCTMCTVSDLEKGARADDLPLVEFQKIINEQYGLVEIKLQGLGEPTMQGDDFFEMIRYARAKHIWVRTTTNASLLHLKDNYRKLVDCGPNEIQISIDGADKEVFEKIRRGAHFETIKKNVRLINDYCLDRNVRITKMWTVVQQNNRHQLFDFVDFAHDHGFRDQAFAFSLTDWGSQEWRDRNNTVTVEDTLTPEIAYQLIEKGEKLGVRVSFWNTTTKYGVDDHKNLCPWPFERAAITSDLRTVPCCTIGNPDHYEIGRDTGKGFGELWSSEEYETFRQNHLDGNIPPVCRGCYHLPENEK